MPGSASSLMALCDDDKLYIVKCANSSAGTNVLANEMLGAELLRAAGLPTPNWKFVRFSSTTLYEPADGVDANNREHVGCGLHFGSELIEPSAGGRLYSFLPRCFFPRVLNRSDFIGALIFDIWAQSTDVRQAVFLEGRASHLFNAHFIDQGHLFGGPNWSTRPRPGASLCLERSMYADLMNNKLLHHWFSRIGTAAPTIVSSTIQAIPRDWYKGDIASLKGTLLGRLPWLEDLFWQELDGMKLPLRRSVISSYEPTSVPTSRILRNRPGQTRPSIGRSLLPVA